LSESSGLRIYACAPQMVGDFDPEGVVSVSRPRTDEHIDAYIMESGDRFGYFFEEHAFLLNGSLRQDERAVDK